MTVELDLAELPFDRRLRAEIVARLAVFAGRRGRALGALADRLPDAIVGPLSRAAAPLRLARSATARVPLDATFPEPPPGGRPARPRASVVVVSHDGDAHLRLCLESIRAHTDPALYEVVVVDNASRDGSRARLVSLGRTWPHLDVVLRDENDGFPSAVNAGVRASSGEVLVVCNHDIVVTPGWLAGLLRHVDLDGCGMVGPVTNDSGDVASVPASYDDLDRLLELAATRERAFRCSSRVADKLSLFCAAIPRRVFDACGGLDESYGLGMFDDDDLCAAMKSRGLDVRLALDVYVHHTAGVAFRALPERDYILRFEINRLRWERKWGRRWRAPGSPNRLF